jgi:hypothetical protein
MSDNEDVDTDFDDSFDDFYQDEKYGSGDEEGENGNYDSEDEEKDNQSEIGSDIEDDDTFDNTYDISNAAEWRDNSKNRVGKMIEVGGIETLGTVTQGSSRTSKLLEKYNHIEISPEAEFQNSIQKSVSDYDLNPEISREAERLINRVYKLESRNPVCLVLALSILSSKDNKTEIDLEKLAKLGNPRNYQGTSVQKQSRLQQALDERNINVIDILRYARYIVPYVS